MTYRLTKSPRFAFWTGVLGGLAAPASIFVAPNYLLADSDLHEMRSDWQRIGDDFRAVMARENVQTVKSAK